MQIKELEYAAGLDRATIRYYEREGLITPVRSENGYRTYSAEDEETLLRIKLLRKLGMSLDNIRQLQQGSMDFSAAMDRQIRASESSINQKRRAKDICIEMQQEVISYQALNARAYLERLDQPAPANSKPEKAFQESVPLEYHPVRRYVARILDYIFLQAIILFVLIVVLRIRPIGNFLSLLVTYGTYLLEIPVNALFLSKLGTTPGKWLMGLRVESADGCSLSFDEAFAREVEVLRFGLGWGIPLWNIWCLFRSYRSYVEHPFMEWDISTEYVYKPWKRGRKSLFALAITLLTAVNVLSSLDLTRPKYRAEELTIKQFAENYNFYVKTLTEDPSRTQLLQSDGTYYPEDYRTVVVHVGGTPQNKNLDFEYITADGHIEKIIYSNYWSDVGMLIPTSTRCDIAVFTLLMSQPRIDTEGIGQFLQDWELQRQQPTGTIAYENIEIKWEFTLENCEMIGDFIHPVDEEVEGNAGVYIEIVIK